MIESIGELYHTPQRHVIVTNYRGTGNDIVKSKPSYTNQQKTGIIKYIMQLDKSRKPSSDKDGMIILNEDTQRVLMYSVFNAL